jgi:hypothetical protein
MGVQMGRNATLVGLCNNSAASVYRIEAVPTHLLPMTADIAVAR